MVNDVQIIVVIQLVILHELLLVGESRASNELKLLMAHATETRVTRHAMKDSRIPFMVMVM